MKTLTLDTADDTLRLGRALAFAFKECNDSHPALLLNGELGAGKTTLVRGLVLALPGGDMAEVSSPSFNIFNLYPTTPAIAHYDLYRLEGADPDDEFFELLAEPDCLVIVEWVQYLNPVHLPSEHLRLNITGQGQGRKVELAPGGDIGLAIAQATIRHFTESQGD